jgi:hypothetical protein
VPPAATDDPHSLAHKLHAEDNRLEALIGRLERWLDKSISRNRPSAAAGLATAHTSFAHVLLQFETSRRPR